MTALQAQHLSLPRSTTFQTAICSSPDSSQCWDRAMTSVHRSAESKLDVSVVVGVGVGGGLNVPAMLV